MGKKPFKIPNHQFFLVRIKSGSNYVFQNNVLSLFLNLIDEADVWRSLDQGNSPNTGEDVKKIKWEKEINQQNMT